MLRILAAGLLLVSVLGPIDGRAAPAPASGTEADTGETSWRINLKDADLGEFITQVARITGRNFVIDPRVKGRITVVSSVSLDRDGVYELFQSVLRVHGFAAVPAGDVVKIVQQTIAKQSSSDDDFDPDVNGEKMVTRVIPATNVPSSELVKILRPLIPQYSHVASVDVPNVVILSDHAENIRRMESIIREIDVADDEEVTVVSLKDAWVENMVALLEQLAPDRIGRNGKGPNAVQVVANARNNSLVLRGKPGPVADLRGLIARLDQPSTNTGATRVFRLRHADAEQVATILDGILSAGAGGGGEDAPVQTMIQPDTSLNALVVRADPSTMSEVASIIESLDIRRTQVLIEAAIVEVSLNDTQNLGVEFAAVDQDGSSVPLVTSPLTGALQALLGSSLADGATGGFDAVGAAASLTSPSLAVAKLSNGVSFAAIIQALGTNNDSNLLSTPSILTLDNEEASIVVGQNVPFRTGSFTTGTDGASNPFTTIQREDVGITLRVIPHVHDGNSVRLEVEQEVSSVVNAAVGDNGFSDIVTNKRTIETTILADDGQTIVLGGLIQDDITESVRKVPLLGDIPLAGVLFRSTASTRVKRNLLVFLRPTVVRDDNEVRAVTQRKYDGVWELYPDTSTAPRDAARDILIDSIYEGRPLPSAADAESD
ncbi:MAG TPA: type II secretion system secretin GspD [Pseudomonadales bacterium]|nr:type II secretion system secretin GspD [Pseudomonadales bacterium]